ncbi:hypothetical protein G6F50_018228 [Rhizopus delemar]|uniref:Uncharacterized protein n=1 Tax=Rhizopus delemar TaxID=936053 RepID=A0A9P6XN16_9FUNG|nr:hypothetical protein G6F50_018228 [Rhizopus delemar]
MAEGFDDALLVGSDDCISEGTTWNLAVHDGPQLLWPRAPALRGHPAPPAGGPGRREGGLRLQCQRRVGAGGPRRAGPAGFAGAG